MPSTVRGAVVVAEVAVVDAERSEANVRSAPTKMVTSVNSSERLWMEIMRKMSMSDPETLPSPSISRDRTLVEEAVIVLGAAEDVASTEVVVHTAAAAMATSHVVEAADGEVASITGSRQLRTSTMKTLTKKLWSSFSTMSKCGSTSLS